MLIIIQAAFTLLARSAGKVLKTAFGWATSTLFGKVPEDRQIFLSIITLASLVWLVVVVGVAFPRFATFLLAFVTLPDWISDTWIRLGMIVAALLIPAVAGYLSLYLLRPDQRPNSIGGRLKAVAKGYPYTLGLAITLGAMLIFAPVMKVRSLLRRQSVAHVPVVIDSKDYRGVLDDVREALRKGGVESTAEPANWLLRLPTRLLTVLAGGALEKLVAEELTTLRGERMEVLVHPSNLVITGKANDVARTRAILAEQLVFSRAHLTWSKLANEIEDDLVALWRRVQSSGEPESVSDELRAVEKRMRSEDLSFEEWEVLYRGKLVVELGVLRASATPMPLEQVARSS